MPNITEAFNETLQGNFIPAVFIPFDATIGHWVFVILYAMVILPIYIKTQNVVMPVILTMAFGGAGLVVLPPEAQVITKILLAVGVMGILYLVFKGD